MILTAEAGIAEVLVTATRALILTNEIERERLGLEEVGSEFEIVGSPWSDPRALDTIVAASVEGTVYSDRPTANERPLPRELILERLVMQPEERERYARLGREAAEAMTDALIACEPGWSEERLAGEGARALWSRGIHPTLILVAGEKRLPLHRHPVATRESLGGRAMMVFCARRHGLYANLTRFVAFRAPSAEEEARARLVAEFEDVAFRNSRPGAELEHVYRALVSAYSERGLKDQTEKQHFGGLTGYLSREAFARPVPAGEKDWPIWEGSALAWNPTLPGAKIEDTVLAGARGVEILTVDPRWPTLNLFGRARPDTLVKS